VAEPLKIRSRGMRAEQTQAEARFWSIVRMGRIQGLHFRRQHRIGNYIADFCCVKRNLVVELLGTVHDSNGAKAYDAVRIQFIQAAGFKVLEFTNDEVLLDPKKVEDTLLRFLTLPC
jgi:5-methyltetrahydrofolate--homocysteine methyltransferase